jgi:hypothetical protein
MSSERTDVNAPPFAIFERWNSTIGIRIPLLSAGSLALEKRTCGEFLDAARLTRDGFSEIAGNFPASRIENVRENGAPVEVRVPGAYLRMPSLPITAL